MNDRSSKLSQRILLLNAWHLERKKISTSRNRNGKQNHFFFPSGYSTHTLGVKSNCKLKYVRGLSCQQYTIEVIPALAKISVTTSLPRTVQFSSLGEPAHVVSNGGITLYAGERFEIINSLLFLKKKIFSSDCTIHLTNCGEQPLELVEISMQSILEPDVQRRTFKWDRESISNQMPVEAGKIANLKIALYAVADFLSPSCDGRFFVVIEATFLPVF